ncbi:asparagine synthase (glutamine-hydrolyzing) [Sutcliffiella cohnii]|uniref:asparagine synthase (glutamine-hydrolyzing) n=1 Tax=Sutcliffiella cohnii TaxID=33932 RepID=UPI002E1F4709|nr:asparagine synthase (glutamine-hydrolyzing) [Sutcliffiella cohnii]
MCGITGLMNIRKDVRHEEEAVRKMTETLTKRGPDDTNIWGNEYVWFGHKRLVVVDPEGGRQPMTKNKNGFSYTICYNGELYNTEDIRKELLKRGYTFNSHSDTEVLLTSYIEWKEDCVHHLNGIFAFSIWDEEREKLFIARDRMGVKPLFYHHDGEKLMFGSELKALLAHPCIKSEVDYDGLAEIFGLGPSRSPGHGLFASIKEIRPAHFMTFSKDGLKVIRYWNVKSKKHTHSLEETVDNVKFLFTDAVKRQLVSDVPVCTFLSGGLDSSAITAIAAEEFEKSGKGPLHTFSIDYEENDQYFKANDFQPNSDEAWIRKMTESYNTVHHNMIISQQELVENLKEAVLVRDQPGMADVDSSLLWFCREIKYNFVVGLSGECADEIFGGYPWFHRPEDLASSNFPWMRSTEARMELLRPEWRRKLQIDDYITTKFEETIAETPRLEGENPVEAKRRELFYLNIIWFMTTLLDRKDRMSMGASLEVRVPFADHRLVEYVWNIPWEMKMYENREKGILRKALEGILPHEVLYRKKSPYPKTHHPVYTKLVKNWLGDILKDNDSPLYEFLDKKKLHEIVDSNGDTFRVPWFGQLMTGPQLLAHLIQIDTWFKKYNVSIKS